MRRPGRPSAAASAFPIDSGWRQLLQPPSELSASQRELFATITSTCKADHFRESDVALLALYVQSIELAQQTGADVAKDPANASGSLLKSYELASRRVLGLAQRLRLSPQSRAPNVSQRSADAGRQPSYYDRVAAGGGQFPGWEEP
jgi:hypothetical protein